MATVRSMYATHARDRRGKTRANWLWTTSRSRSTSGRVRNSARLARADLRHLEVANAPKTNPSLPTAASNPCTNGNRRRGDVASHGADSPMREWLNPYGYVADRLGLSGTNIPGCTLTRPSCSVTSSAPYSHLSACVLKGKSELTRPTSRALHAAHGSWRDSIHFKVGAAVSPLGTADPPFFAAVCYRLAEVRDHARSAHPTKPASARLEGSGTTAPDPP